MRVPDNLLEELIENEGELVTGPIRGIGILRLALDLREARQRLKDISLKAKNSDNKLH